MPGTFDDASLAAYLALGVTRVNLGVQSFDAAMLKGARLLHLLIIVRCAASSLKPFAPRRLRARAHRR